MRSPKFCPIITHTTWPIIPSRINKFVFDLVPKTNGKVQVAQGRARGYGEHSTHYQDCATVLPCTYLACRQISRVSWGSPRRRLGHENRIIIRGWFLGIVFPTTLLLNPISGLLLFVPWLLLWLYISVGVRQLDTPVSDSRTLGFWIHPQDVESTHERLVRTNTSQQWEW